MILFDTVPLTHSNFHYNFHFSFLNSDFLQKAATHVNKALTLDYGSVSDALANDSTMADALGGGGGGAGKGGSKGSKDDGEGKNDNGDAPDTMRPLDRFLMPLQKKLGMWCDTLLY